MNTLTPPSLTAQVSARCCELIRYHFQDATLHFVGGHWTNGDLDGLMKGQNTMIVFRKGPCLVTKYVDRAQTQWFFDAYSE